MAEVLAWLQHYGLAVVFVNVLLAQLGLPLPAYPVLVVSGALSARGQYPMAALLATAVGASLIADLAWYAAGRRYGSTVLKTLCRISMSPDSCVRQTESIFTRWGVPSLAVAKLVPGFGAIAMSIAGNQRVSMPAFVFFAALGAALWAGIALALGAIFSDAVSVLLDTLAELGRIGLGVVLGCFVLFVLVRWLQRWLFRRELRMARISVDALHGMYEAGAAPAVLDVRAPSARVREGYIPGSIPWSVKEGRGDRLEVPRDAEVVVYCACPNEESAALVAKRLKQAGFRHVRPLYGGIDAWVAAGLPLERDAA